MLRSSHAPRFARAFAAVLLALSATVCSDQTTLSPLKSSDDASRSTLAGLSITPPSDTVLIGHTIPLSASGTQGNKAVVWTSSNTTFATVASTGFATANVTGRAPGLVTITGVSGNRSGIASVLVIPVPVRSVTVTPDTSRVQRGDSTRFTATPRDSAGNPLTGRTITWTSSDTAIAIVSPAGTAHARARGTARISATSEGVVGQSTFIVVVPELTVPTMSVQDSANVGDTLRVWYSVQNLGDTPLADSVIVRVGLRSNTTGTVLRALRRAVPRVGALQIGADSVRFQVPSTPPGAYSVVVYADCRDLSGASEEARLADCIATPAAAGTIVESDETNNSRSRAVGIRGPELTATTLTAPDTVLTRTNATASLAITNSGSSTGVGFDVIAGLFDGTTSTVVSATTTTTPALGSRQSRIVSATFAIPAALNLTHQYQVRAYADCKNAGATPADRLRTCILTPGGPGDISEANENDNGASRATIAISNVDRVTVTPDTLRFNTLSDSAALTAAALDRSNAPVAGVSVAWVSLDNSASVTPAGLVRPIANGTARIVATIEGKADTSIVIVSQQIASVVVTPDTSLVGVGATVSLNAVLRDGAGNLVTSVRPTWSTLEATIAAVNDSGRVSGAAVGTARIVATRDARADTVLVYVVPTDYTHRWLGANSLGWNQTSNWFPHTIPANLFDRPFIPAGTSQRPFLVSDVTTGNITVSAGTSLDLRGRTLSVWGSVDASGPIDTGSVVMVGGGMIGGRLPSVTIRAPISLAARTTASSITVRDSTGRLTLNGRTLVTSFFSTINEGTITASNAYDTLWVTSNASFSGNAALSAGVLRLDGHLSQSGSFNASGSHTTVFAGPTQQFVTFADSMAGFQNANVLNNAGGVQLQSTIAVRGLLRLVNGGRLSSPGTVRFFTRLPDIAQGVYSVATTTVSGSVSLQGNHVFPGMVYVENNGVIGFNGHTLDARQLNTYNGTLNMTSPADSLIVREQTGLYGRENFFNGTTIFQGMVSLGLAPGSALGYNASGPHTTIFSGQFQSWLLDQADKHFIANVRFTGGSNVQLNSDLHVRGRLTMDIGSTLTQPQGNYIHYYGPLPDATRGAYQVYNTKIANNLTLAEDVVLPRTTNLWMRDSITFDLNGHKLDVNAFWTGGPASRFVMNGIAPAESLIVRERVHLWGMLTFGGGVIANYGDHTLASVPLGITGPNAPSRTKTVFLGGRPHQLTSTLGDSVVFADVDIQSGNTVTSDRHIVLDGLLSLGAGATLNLPQGYDIRVNHVMPAVELGTLNAYGINVNGYVDMDASRRYPATPFMVRVTPGARLRPNGHTLDIAGVFAVEGGLTAGGQLVMDHAADTVIVGQWFYLWGSAQLGAGALIAKADFYRASTSTFVASGTHTTVFAGTTPQRLDFGGNPGSYFNNLKIDNAAGVDFDVDLDIRGQLRGAGGVIRSTMTRALNVQGGLDVAALVLDGAPLNVTGGTLARFDNVTFRNFPGLFPAQFRIRHAGTGATFTMNNINFLSDVDQGAYWIDADDTDPMTGVLRLDVTSPQSAQGPAKTSAGTAVVTWRTP